MPFYCAAVENSLAAVTNVCEKHFRADWQKYSARTENRLCESSLFFARETLATAAGLFCTERV